MSEERKQIGTLFGKPIVIADEPLGPQEPLVLTSLEAWQEQRKREIAQAEYANAVHWPLVEKGS